MQKTSYLLIISKKSELKHETPKLVGIIMELASLGEAIWDMMLSADPSALVIVKKQTRLISIFAAVSLVVTLASIKAFKIVTR